MIPSSAKRINTPLVQDSWRHCLQEHPNQRLTQFFLKGISEGFRVGYGTRATNPKSSRRNLQSALLHPEVIDNYIQNELLAHRVAGPFTVDECHSVIINRFGVIPKHHQANKWRLIVDLSHPEGFSINDGIPSHLCSLSYITVDDAIQEVLQTGPGTLLAKVDIKNAFRLLPVHPADRCLLGMKWKDAVYIDTCLPFGLRSAPRLFNILADLLTWSGQHRGVSFVIHYLDDFLTVGPPSSDTCQHNLDILKQLCDELGVPLALEKVEGPSTTISFLGILIDTVRMEIRLPEDKLVRIKDTLSTWLGKKKATKREILSLVGLLQHATKVVRCGRTFVGRMYAAAAKVKKLHFFTRLNREFRSDLMWWHTFVQAWNGLSILHHPYSVLGPANSILTDASGTWGCGAIFHHQWFQWQWSSEWTDEGIMAKELVPIVLAIVVWGPYLRKNTLLLQCDNLSLVTAINKGACRDRVVMHLLRCMWFFVAHFDINIVAKHLPGKDNIAADKLSRNNTDQTFLSQAGLSSLPTPLPPTVHQIISPKGLDWLSPHFQTLLKKTLALVTRVAQFSS